MRFATARAFLLFCHPEPSATRSKDLSMRYTLRLHNGTLTKPALAAPSLHAVSNEGTLVPHLRGPSTSLHSAQRVYR